MPKELKLPEQREVKFHHVDAEWWMDENRNPYQRDVDGVFHAIKESPKSKDRLFLYGFLAGSVAGTAVVLIARKVIEYYLGV